MHPPSRSASGGQANSKKLAATRSAIPVAAQAPERRSHR